MLDDIAGQVLGGIARFIGQIISEVFVEILTCGPGYLICRAFGYKGIPNGWLPAAIGIMFWLLVTTGGYWLFATCHA